MAQSPPPNPSATAAQPRAASRPRRLLRFAAFALVFLLLGLGVLIAFAPAIASGFVPSIARSAAKSSIAGGLDIASASLSWSGPQRFSGIRLKDPAGNDVAALDAELSAGLWSLLRGSKDLGTLTLSGKADLVKAHDGSTNLQKAIAPAVGAPASGSSSLPAGLAAKLAITKVDLSLKELDAAGAVASTSTLSNLKGSAALSTTPAKASADISGSVGDGARSGSLKLTLTLDNFADAQGRLTPDAAKADLALQSGALPVALIDAAANLKGLLIDALGPTADIDLAAKGDAAAGSARIRIDSPNLATALTLKLDKGALVAEAPGTVRVQSTAFLGRIPAVRDALARAGITIEAWPVFDATISALTLPIPKSSAPPGAAGPDLRGVSLDVAINTTAIAARLRDASTTPAPAQPLPPALAAAAAKGRPLALSPATLSIKTTDLAAGLRVSANASASLDNQSAGVLALQAEAAGLLDPSGRLALTGGLPAELTGSVSAQRVSTTLAQAILDGLTPPAPDPASPALPIDLPADVGPTLDLTLAFRAAAAPTSGQPTDRAIDADLLLDASNLRFTAPLRFASSTLTSREPVRAELRAAGNLARRVLARGTPAGQTPAVALAGDPSLTLTVSDLRFPLDPAAAPGTSPLDRAALNARLDVGRFDASLASAPSAGPITATSLRAELALAPGAVTRARASAALAHAAAPFTLDADLALPGLSQALASTAPNALIPGVGPLRIQGAIRLTDAPASLARLAPGDRPAPAAAAQAPALLPTLVDGLVGTKTSLTLTFEPGAKPADPQAVLLALTGEGLTASLAADLAADQARVRSFSADATVRPDTVAAVLRAAGQPADDPRAIRVRGPARIALSAQPFALPFLAGTLNPDWARAPDAQLALAIREPLLLANIPAGDRALSGGLRNAQASATFPLSSLRAGAQPGASAKAIFTASILQAEGQPVGDAALQATVTPDRSAVDLTATLTGLDTAAIDSMLDRPGLLAGALGATADLSAQARQSLAAATAPAGAPSSPAPTSQPLRAKVQVTKSPRLATDPLDIIIDDTRIALAAPAKLNWTIDPAWADRYLLAGTPDKPQSFRLIGPTALAVDLRALSISKPQSAGDLVLTGPFKPGLFALDARATAPRLQIQPLDATPAAAPQPPVTLEGVAIEAASNPQNQITFTIRAASVASAAAGAPASQPVTLTGAIKDAAAANGALDTEHLAADLNLQAPAVPTALIDSVAGMNGRLAELLGPNLRAALTTTNLSRKPGSQGQVAIDIRSFRPPTSEPAALVFLDAPTRDGVVLIQPAKPVRLELAEFNVGEQSPLIQTLGIVASMSKDRLDDKGQPNPARITSANLRLPLGWRRGERQQLNGDVDVALGTVNYRLRTGFSNLIASSMLKDVSRSAQQPPMKPFRVTIREGVAEYSGVEIPIRVGIGLGEEIVNIPLSGRVDLVNETIDAEASLPLELVSSTVLSVLPIGVSDIRKDLLGFMERDPKAAVDPAQQARAQKSRGIRVPVRVRGPMNSPKFDVDVDLFGVRSGNLLQELAKNPVRAIEGIQDAVKDIGDLFKKPKK